MKGESEDGWRNKNSRSRASAAWPIGTTASTWYRPIVPLLVPADFQGLKIRIPGRKMRTQYFRELGSIPQIMAFSEVYQALQTGVVDGEENTPSNYLTQKFHEVQKHITVSYHAHLQYTLIVNSKFWNGLPADMRSAR